MGVLLKYSQFAKAVGLATSTVSLMVKRGEIVVTTGVDGVSGIDSSQIPLVMKNLISKQYSDKGILFINVEKEGLGKVGMPANSGYTPVDDIEKKLNSVLADIDKTAYSDEEILQNIIPKYKREIINEFIKRYDAIASTYMMSLLSKYEALRSMSCEALRNFIYQGVISEDTAKLFEEAGIDYNDIQRDMDKSFSSLVSKLSIKWADKSDVISRKDLSFDFMNRTGREYNLIFSHPADNEIGYMDGTNNKRMFYIPNYTRGNERTPDYVKIFEAVKVKNIKNTHFSSAEGILGNGYYSSVDITKDLSDEGLGKLKKILRSGFYKKIVLNVDKKDARDYLPECIADVIEDRYSYGNIFYKDSHRDYLA